MARSAPNDHDPATRKRARVGPSCQRSVAWPTAAKPSPAALTAVGVPAAAEPALDTLLGLLSKGLSPPEAAEEDADMLEGDDEAAWQAAFDAISATPRPACASASNALGAVLARARLSLERGVLERCAPAWAHAAGDTLLCASARVGDRGALGALLAAGARANTLNRAGDAPLRLACGAGHLGYARALARGGAALDGGAPDAARTPFFLAAARGHAPVCRWLAASGGAHQVTKWLNAVKRDKNGRSRTPLMVASERGHADVVACIAGELGASPEATTSDGATALTLAASRGHTSVTQYLRALSAKPRYEPRSLTADNWLAASSPNRPAAGSLSRTGSLSRLVELALSSEERASGLRRPLPRSVSCTALSCPAVALSCGGGPGVKEQSPLSSESPRGVDRLIF